MKRLILSTILVAVMASMSMAAPIYTLTVSDLTSMVNSFTSTGATSGSLLVTTTTYSDGVSTPTLAVGYEASLHPGIPEVTPGDGGNPYHPWARVGIGFPWVPAGPGGQSAPQGDLSVYTDYSLVFYNDNDDAWAVNLFMNTGWTDAPYNETDVYSENGWITINPGQATTVTMSLVGIPNLNHVSNIGLQIGANMDGVNPNPSGPDSFHISVSPIPEPMTICLLGLGGLVVISSRKRNIRLRKS